MKRDFEASDLAQNNTQARPGVLMCACCAQGGAPNTPEKKGEVQHLLQQIRADSNVHIKLRTAFDDAGARNEWYATLTPQQRKRDLDILHALGAIPEMVRTAQCWSEILEEYLPHPGPICAPYQTESSGWKNCPHAIEDYYAKGLKALCNVRSEKAMACSKAESCKALTQAQAVQVRSHHFLCTICFVGGTYADAPIPEDNLYELWDKIKQNPDLPVTVIEGPGECIICPPCYAFNPDNGLCFYSCSLRDRKKDLDVFAKLGIEPGETLPAREILRRIYITIKNVNGLCRFEERRGFEWRNCRTHPWGTFEKGMAIVARELELEK